VRGSLDERSVVSSAQRRYLKRPSYDSTGWFNRAVERSQVQKITPHDLRHTCASLAVSSGANVLAVSRMLGHKDPSITLRIYADLFGTTLMRLPSIST
jgi:integrase